MNEKPKDKKKDTVQKESLFVPLRGIQSGQATPADPSRSAPVSAQGTEKKRTLDPKFFLGKVDELKKMETEDNPKTDEEIAGLLTIEEKHVGIVRNLLKLTDEVKEMVSGGIIPVSLGAAIGAYPPGTHFLLADSIRTGKLKPTGLTSYGSIKAKKGDTTTLKQRIKGAVVKGAEIEWPEGLDENGKPIKK